MRRAILPCLLASTTACAHGDRGTDQELSRLRREVRTLERDLAAAKDRIQDLDRRVTLLNAQPVARAPEPRAGVGRSVSAPQPSTAAQPNLPVVRIAPKYPTGEVEADVGALDDGRPPILIKLGPSDAVETEKLAVDANVLRRPDPVLHAEDPKEAYRRALTALREHNQPERAKSMFEAFSRRHPDSSLADNAVYWLGEAHFALGEYRDAIACFERLERRFPRSSKIPYARLRWGESLMRSAQPERAAVQLRLVVERYPDSPAAKEASRLLANDGEKGSM